jgi:hypothetical protein
MTDLSTQFHALPDEFMALVSPFVHENGIHVTAIKFPPFEAYQVDKATISSLFHDNSVKRLFLTLHPPILPASGMNDFLARNGDALILDIGRQSKAGLKESCLAARTNDLDALKTWRKLASKLKAITKAGAIAVNPTTGATSRDRNHRFTAGAKALDDQGVPMLPVAGSAVLHFE